MSPSAADDPSLAPASESGAVARRVAAEGASAAVNYRADRPAAEAAAAEAWVAAEPFCASGEVFTGVTIRPWSQVVPETGPGALDRAIEHLATSENHPGTAAAGDLDPHHAVPRPDRGP